MWVPGTLDPGKSRLNRQIHVENGNNKSPCGLILNQSVKYLTWHSGSPQRAMPDSGSPPRAAVLFNGVFALIRGASADSRGRPGTLGFWGQTVHRPRNWGVFHYFPGGQDFRAPPRHPWRMFEHPTLAEVAGLPALASLLAEQGVSDLVCNGHEAAMVLRGGNWHSVPPVFASADQLEFAARALAAAAGRRLDLAQPFANFTLGARLRVHAVLASAISSNTLLSIRAFGERPFGLKQLVSIGQLDEATRSRLVELMRAGASVLISGASGSGKTSFLRALLLEVENTRVISIEDIAELRLGSQSFVSLTSRESNVEGKGEIDMNALLVESLRMRPDRIVIGEVRSRELITLLQAANSGHAVATTIHANSSAEVLARLTSIASASGISSETLRVMAANAFDAYVHIESINGRRSYRLHEAKP